MKKIIFACLSVAALVSLSACTTGNENQAGSTPGRGPQSLVSFPDTTITTTQSPYPLPRPAGPP
jgi:hypothetical protein